MNKIKLVLFLALISTLAQGQLFHNVGIKSGVSIANQERTNKSNNFRYKPDYHTGLYVGLYTEVFRKKVFSLALDLGYMQKGYQDDFAITDEFNPEGTGETKTVVSRFDFLSLSPTAKFRLQKKHFATYLFAGPRFDYYLGYYTNDQYDSEPSDINAMTFGVSYGIGLEYLCDRLVFSVESQHQPDLTKLIDSPASINNSGLNVINRAFAVTLGIKYIL